MQSAAPRRHCHARRESRDRRPRERRDGRDEEQEMAQSVVQRRASHRRVGRWQRHRDGEQPPRRGERFAIPQGSIGPHRERSEPESEAGERELGQLDGEISGM